MQKKDNTDEFLVEKKSPLVMPPDFNELPLPKTSENIEEKESENNIEKLIEINFDGYAIGGLAVGEKQSEMFKILNQTAKFLPEQKPRYLMGVGTPSDILGAVKEGIDMFDCVMPTRSGRTGLAFTWQGKLNLKNSKFKNDKSPLDIKCDICLLYTSPSPRD